MIILCKKSHEKNLRNLYKFCPYQNTSSTRDFCSEIYERGMSEFSNKIWE